MNLEWHGKFTFIEEKASSLVDTTGGNYMISVKLKNGNYRSIYVGKAENLQKRLLEHLSDKEKNKCLRDHVKDHTVVFRFCYVNSEENRSNVEHTLYHKYPHECNEKEPEGKIIEITALY
jgi:excinuclease UvrABC nuclease subunit